MKEIVLSEDILPNLYDIYKESKFKHPLLNPYQIYARQNIRKIKFLLLKEGYTYFNVRKNRYLKILTAIFPLITSRNYEDEIKDFIRNYKNYFGITKILHVYTRNELDYIKLFNNIEKENYSYVINDDSWKPNKKINYYVKLAEKENIHIINEFNFDIYKEYYENCYLQTLESKESTKLQAGYKFFEYLAKKDMLRSVFGLLDNKIISGVFILYDEESRIGYYIDAASSQ